MFIVVEWVDGSGKATQAGLVSKLLRDEWKQVGNLSFPAYGQRSCYFVEQFLHGQYGPVDTIDPYLASTFYTLDRLGQRETIKDILANNEYLITDRYSTATFVHRGSQYLYTGEEVKLQPFFDRVYDFEFVKAELPKPDLIVFLSMSIDNIKMLLEKKSKEERGYLNIEEWLDRAETNLRHQIASLKVWREILPNYFDNYEVVNCENDLGVLLTREEIAQKIFALITNYQWR